jgi:hypothetical protein
MKGTFHPMAGVATAGRRPNNPANRKGGAWALHGFSQTAQRNVV